MGLLEWLRAPGSDTAIGVDAAYSGVQSVDPGMHTALLTLAGYSPNQVPTSVTRAEAMKVPALQSGVKILCGIAAQLPLVAEPSGEPSAFLAELDPNMAPGWTVSQTVSDLIFAGQAWWYVTSRSARGFPRTVQYIAGHRLNVTNPEQPTIDGVHVSPNDLIRFDGVTPGILDTGSEAISTALANVRQTRAYAQNPMPHMYLTDEDGAEPLEAAEARDYLTALRDSVTGKGSAYLRGLKLNQVGWTSSEIQLVEARQLDAVEMARLLAIPTRYLAAPEQGSSLTYANLGEVRRDLLEVGGLALYASPIEQRLSMPDVTPRGTRVRFDAESFFLRVTPDQPSPDAAQQQADTPEVPA